MALQRVVLFAMLSYTMCYLVEGFSFSGYNGYTQQQQSMPFVRQPPGNARAGVQWGRPAQQTPIVLPCDGSPEITRACDTFCKSIKAAEGACVLNEQTCGCTGGSLAPPVPAQTGPVSPQAPPVEGIRILVAPDLSQPTSTPQVQPVEAPASQTRKKRRSRDALLNV